MNAIDTIRESNAHLFASIAAITEMVGPINEQERQKLMERYIAAQTLMPERPFDTFSPGEKNRLLACIATHEFKKAYGKLLEVVSFCEAARLKAIMDNGVTASHPDEVPDEEKPDPFEPG